MKRIIRNMSGRAKIIIGIFAVVIGFSVILNVILSNTLGEPNYGEIIGFENGNPSYEKTVEAGTTWDNLGLPQSLRAIIKIQANAATPTSLPGPATPTSLGEPATPTSLPEIITREIPVTWAGEYNGDVPGTYVLTAQFDGYSCTCEKPIIVITVMPKRPMRAAPPGSKIIIPIGAGAPGVGTYDGYTVTFDSGWGNKITFNTDANNYTYEFTFSGSSTTIADVKFYDFILLTGVDTTITLNGINCTPYRWLSLQGNAKLTLLLAGTNTVQRNLRVPSGTTLIIDSAESPGSESGSLSTTLNNFAGACIGSETGNSGQITINGGTLVMTQAFTTASSSTGAAIGGGSGGAGNVTISGGNVTATAVNGAAIGGGQNAAGNVIITNGTVNATIAYNGGNAAGIGGGNGTAGVGNVTIGGGTINVTSVYLGSGGYGAGIGGGQNASGNVTITDGLITVYAANGAGIGNGYGIAPTSGTVNISGGKIIACSTEGAGIGTGYQNSTTACTLNISHTADIVAFSNMLYNNGVGIQGGGNIGDGYFVNTMYFGGIPKANNQYLFVYAAGDNTAPIRIVPIPYYDFTVFSFTTGITSPKDYNIYIGTYAGGVKQFVKYGITPADPIISSVNAMNQYKNNTGASVSMQRIDYGSGSAFPVRFPVTEYHVDIYDNLIDGVTNNPRMPLYPINTPYNGTPLTPPNIGADYTYEGWYSGTFGGVPASGNPSIQSVAASATIYFVYNGAPPEATVTEKYVDINGAPIPDIPDTYTKVEIGGAYEKAVPDIGGYIIRGYNIDSPPTGEGTFDTGVTAQINQVDTDMIIYFVYEYIKPVKNAYANYDPIDNGTSQNPVPVNKGDNITYDITFYNRKPSGSISNPNFYPQAPRPVKINFINGSFETPTTATNIQTNNVPGWTNTAEPLIEIHHVGSNTQFAPSAPDGVQYAELNAQTAGTLYQTVATVPGTKVYWEFYHGARGVNATNTDVMDFLLGPTTSALVQQVRASDSWTLTQPYKWGYYHGTYIVPAGQTSTVFAFKSFSTSSGNNSLGNFLDAIRLYTSSYIELAKSNDTAGVNVNIGDTVTYTITAKNTGESDASNVKISDALPVGIDFIPGTVTINGAAASSYSYDATSRTLNINVGAGATSSAGGLIKGDGSFSTDCDNQYTVTFQVKVVSDEIAEEYNQAKVTYEDRNDTAHDQYINYSNVDMFGIDANAVTTVTDTIPNGLIILSVSDNGAIGIDGKTVTWTIDSSYNEGLITLTVVTEVDNNGKFINTATVTPWFTNVTNTNYTYHEFAEILADVTISKEVTGINADKTKYFTFTVSFEDDNNNLLNTGSFAYTGGTLPNMGASPPQNGTLNIINGEAVFTLQHGQTITIKGVPANFNIKIAETPDGGYSTAYKDSGDLSDPGTAEMDYKIVGESSRTFEFINRRETPPPTGIDEGFAAAEVMLTFSILLFLSGIAGVAVMRKSKRSEK